MKVTITELHDAYPAHMLFYTIVILLVVLATLIGSIAVIIRRRKKEVHNHQALHTAHSNDIIYGNHTRNYWHEEIDDIVQQVHDEQLSINEATNRLGQLLRNFASSQLHYDITTITVSELHTIPRTQHTAAAIQQLQQTLQAMYPPEFADSNSQSTMTTNDDIDTIAQWVRTYVERWR